MRQRDAAAFLFLSTLACCEVCLTTQIVNGEEPVGDSPAEAMARQEIIDSPRWAEAQQQLNDWLSIQSVYTEAQVEALKSELRNRISVMSAAELEVFLEEMETKVALLMSPISSYARRTAAKYKGGARERYRKKFGVEDPIRMPSVAIEAALLKFAADLQLRLATSAAFIRSREGPAKAGSMFKTATRSNRKAATYGPPSNSRYARRSNRRRARTYRRSRYSIGRFR